jgi:competence protein ComEA
MNRSVLALVSALALFGSLPVIGQGTQQPAKPKAATATAPADAVNLNTATVTQLATLPGIGPKTAELIVQYRQKNGSFKKIEE